MAISGSASSDIDALSATALVATADPQLRSLLAMTLRGNGIDVQECHTLHAAADASRCHAALFVIDGDTDPTEAISLTRSLRHNGATAGAAIVMLSFQESIEAYDAGVDLVLMKPVSMNIFLARIRSILRRCC